MNGRTHAAHSLAEAFGDDRKAIVHHCIHKNAFPAPKAFP